MLSKEQKEVVIKLQTWLDDTFNGSGDPEQADAVEICAGLSAYSLLPEKKKPPEMIRVAIR